ncbi:hypothetical protein amrb99_35360 [Actinomadura sp. RB99]|nr:hypothetical protein [Actinomadura sp. RB99]
MRPLVDALRAAGLLVGLPVGDAGILGALSTAAGIAPPAPFDVDVAVGPVSGRVHGVTVTGGAMNARLAIPLQGAESSAALAGNAVTLTAVNGPTLTLDISTAGIRWSAPGPIEFQASPAHLALPGPVSVALTIAAVMINVSDDALSLEVRGTLQVDGIPSSGTLDIPFTAYADHEGFGGSARGQAGPAAFALGWSQAHDPFPTSIDIAVPFSPPDASGISGAVVDAGASMVRTRLVRGPGGYGATIAIESGDDGVLSSHDERIAALAVLATATAGDTAAAPYPPDAAELAPLMATAALLGTALGGTGSARVTAVRFDLATPHRAQVDYEADLSCAIDAGILKAATASPMRVAVRNATLEYGSAMPTLSFAGSSIDVSDTGRWEVTRPAGVLQVAGVRSGHGSSFFELDLRVAFEAGPVKAAGAVLRVTLDHGVRVSLQGFSLRVDVPGLVSGEGRLAFDASGGFAAALRVGITPLNLAASAGLTVEKANDGRHEFRSMLADLAVDLPAPLPLANSGLGLFGIQAILGLNRNARVEGDLRKRLAWRPDRANTSAAPGSQMFGAAVAIGTLPDLGFAFSALGRVVVRVPDVAINVALAARLLGGRAGVMETPDTEAGVSLLGLLVVDPARELYAGVTGEYRFPPGADWSLLEIQVPAEARYPVPNPAGWFVHIGTDGRRGGGGPIRATVLPEVFGVGAEAFLMLHGDGFDPPLDVPQSPASGFAAAAGFSFSAKYGFPPVWAGISVGAVVAVGTRPLFVAGRATARGALHLGPFSLGLDAVLKLQLGPGGTRYAELEACGSIDLWFFEISGCVHIGFGAEQRRELDMPADPLVSATVADRSGVAGAGSGALTADAASAPVMWPDGTVLLGFAPGPKYLGPASDPFHAALDQSSATKGPGTVAAADGTIGSPSYPARWSLTGLGLHRVSGGGPTPLAGPLPARWQLPPTLAPTTPASSRVLALFTKNAALWSLSLLDGGAGDPANPVDAHERGCRRAWAPAGGWAVGGRATASGQSWSLPPLDARPAPATASTVHARVTTSVPAIEPLDEVPAVRAFAGLLPPASALVIGGPPSVDPVRVDGLPDFPGVLPLADIVAVLTGELGWRAVTTVVIEPPLEPAVRVGPPPRLVLWSERGFTGVEVWSDTPSGPVPWSLAHEQRASVGGSVAVLEWREDEAVDVVRIRHAHLTPRKEITQPALGIVAIGGVTSVAAGAAADANSAGAAADADAHASATTQPPPSPFTEGTTYRLDVGWSGSLDGDPRPAVGGTTARHFKIAEHAPDRPPDDVLYQSITTFHPAMLGRYLAGYTVHGDVPWFLDDPIIATFSSRTITSVAGVYGYEVKIVVDRTDPPPGWAEDGNALLRQPFAPDLVPSVQFDHLEAVDRLGVARLEPGCTWPRDAADAQVHAVLLPEAAYEVGVLIDPRDKDALGRPKLPHRVECMLPPVSFRTSRWRDPKEMFRVLGFDQAAPDVRHVGVRTLVADPGEDSDGAIRQALREAGAELGPLDVPARTTVLWAPDGAGGHVVAAVLLEAMEPLVRGDRLGEITLTGFKTRAESAATSLLFVAASTTRGGPLTLTWREHYNASKKTWSASRTATLAVPSSTAVPALAWEVWP